MGRTAPKVAAGGLFVAQLEHGAHHHTHHRRREERLPQQRVAPPVPLITTAQYPTPGQREGDPEGWSTVLVTALGSWEKHREGDPKGWSTVLVTALGSWEKPVPRGHMKSETTKVQYE